MKRENQRNLLIHFILWVVTFGVWMRMWLFKTTNILNSEDETGERPSWLCLLLSFFVPFYYFFWTYETVKSVGKLAKKNGVEFKGGTQYTVFSIVFKFVSAVLIQDKLNEIIDVVDPAPKAPKVIEPQTFDAPIAPTVIKEPTISVASNEPVAPAAPEAPATATPAPSNTAYFHEDETVILERFRKLLEQGIISQEDFDAKKKELFGE